MSQECREELLQMMKLNLDPSLATPRSITAESLALATWYDSQPGIRRLWGIRSAEVLRVIVAVETTLDGDDIYPVWFANTRAWANELRSCTGSAVRLELVHGLPSDGIDIDEENVVIADLFWRDATLIQPHTAL
jgi:hypothetical protein